MANPYNCKDRLQELMTSGEFSDCVFIVEGQRLNVHRLILSIASPVFKVMLNGCWASSENIVIPDIDSDIFRSMLKYMYADQIDIETVQQACDLLYASKKYMISYLVSQCIIYIKREICIDNVLQVYEFSKYIQEDDLTAHVFNYICKNANLILWNHLEDIDSEMLRAMLGEDKLNIEESSLISFVFEWSKQQCIKMHADTSVKNQRKILEKEGLLSCLRFLTLGRDDIAKMSLMNCPISEQQIKFIELNFQTIQVQPEKVSEVIKDSFGLCPIRKPRGSIPNKPIYCIRSLLGPSRPLVISNYRTNYYVRIKSNKTITVHSLTIPTQTTPEYYQAFAFTYDTSSLDKTYNENIQVSIARIGSDTFADTIFHRNVSYDSTVSIDLESPFTFVKDHWYRVVFRWPRLGSDLKYQAVWRSDITYCQATIQYDEFWDNIEKEYRNSSFLVGMKYTV